MRHSLHFTYLSFLGTQQIIGDYRLFVLIAKRELMLVLYQLFRCSHLPLLRIFRRQATRGPTDLCVPVTIRRVHLPLIDLF